MRRICLAVAASALAAAVQPLAANFAADGSYSINVAGDEWFTAPDVSIVVNDTLYSRSAGTLRLQNLASSDGVDGIGAFSSQTATWQTTAGGLPVFAATIRSYVDVPAVSFTGSYLTPSTGGSSSIAGTHLAANFPSLGAAAGLPAGIGYLYQDPQAQNCGWTVAGGQGFPPTPSDALLVMAPKPNASAPVATRTTLAFASVENMFSVRQSTVTNSSYGPPALVLGPGAEFQLASGYAYSAVLVASWAGSSADAWTSAAASLGMPAGGVNSAIHAMGNALLGWHGKLPRPQPTIDAIHSHWGVASIGWFFYDPCDCGRFPNGTCIAPGVPHNMPAGHEDCRTYADSYSAVWQSWIALMDPAAPVAPPAHFLIDSWWYGEGIYGGVYKWESSPDLMAAVQSFPDGIPAFLAALGPVAENLTLWAHNGRWMHTPYASEYPFSQGLPQGRQLWDYLFQVNKAWNLGMIKQDHVAESIAAAGWVSNTSLLSSWWSGMSDSGADNGVAVMFCCSPPRVLHTGISMPAATSARSSPDYVYEASGAVINQPVYQWAVGVENAFHYFGMGLLPDKDGFYSNGSMVSTGGDGVPSADQPPFYGFTEKNAVKHALQAALSFGPWAVSDAPGSTNMTLVAAFTRSDGTVLRTSRPQTAIDAEMLSKMFGQWLGAVASIPQTASSSSAAASGVSYPPSGQSLPNGKLGEVYSTVTVLPASGAAGAATNTWTTVVAAQVSGANLSLACADIGVSCNATVATYAWDLNAFSVSASGGVAVVSTADGALLVNVSAAADYATLPQVVIVAPVVANAAGEGIVLLGEIGKGVPVSSQRIASVGLDPGGSGAVVAAVVGGRPGAVELVTLAYCKVAAGAGSCGPVLTAGAAVAAGQPAVVALV